MAMVPSPVQVYHTPPFPVREVPQNAGASRLLADKVLPKTVVPQLIGSAPEHASFAVTAASLTQKSSTAISLVKDVAVTPRIRNLKLLWPA